MSTVDPVDDEDMGDEQEGSGIPPIPLAARRFLVRHRAARDGLGSAGRNADEGDDEGSGSDNGEWKSTSLRSMVSLMPMENKMKKCLQSQSHIWPFGRGPTV